MNARVQYRQQDGKTRMDDVTLNFNTLNGGLRCINIRTELMENDVLKDKKVSPGSFLRVYYIQFHRDTSQRKTLPMYVDNLWIGKKELKGTSR